MSQPKLQLSTLNIWTMTLKLIAKYYKEILPFLCLFVVLPQALFTFTFAQLSFPVAENIKSMTSSSLSSAQGVHYKELISLASQFFSVYVSCGLIVVLSTLYAYIFLTINALSSQDLLTKTNRDFTKPYKATLQILIPKGFLVLMGVALLSFEQFIFGPFRVFSILALVGIVLLVQNKIGVFSSFWQALTMKYVSKAPGKSFATFVIALSTGILVYLYEVVLNFLNQKLLTLDQWLNISRDIWEYSLPGFPCTVVFLATQIINIFAYAFLLVFMAFFTSTLYGQVRKTLSERT